MVARVEGFARLVVLGRVAATVLPMSVAASSVSCAYLQHQAEQKRAAERLRPATLEAHRANNGLRRTVRIRAYATQPYAAETVNWEHQFETLLTDANRILEPALGITLRNGGTSLWEPASGSADPSRAIEELAREDTGKDADWVVGFLQSVPKLVTDYHKLAVGKLFSKYLVCRGSANATEMAHIEKLGGVGEAEQQKIYSERRRHKIVAVFLHELGHTLGATHRAARDTIMSPVYDSDERGYDEATLGLLRITLPQHLAGTPYLAAADAVRYLEKDDGGWVGSDRAAWLEILRRVSTPQQQAVRAAPPLPTLGLAVAQPPPGDETASRTPMPLTTFSDGDRATFNAALDLEKKGDPRASWNTALPLFDAHPRVLELQDSRCRLAKARGFMAGVVDAYCERFVSLGGKLYGVKRTAWTQPST